jgi:hypothetical protein
VRQAAKRKALYPEFIIEASKHIAEAWSHQPDDPATVVAALYSAVGRNAADVVGRGHSRR